MRCSSLKLEPNCIVSAAGLLVVSCPFLFIPVPATVNDKDPLKNSHAVIMKTLDCL
ncbi:hypothetical protein X975_08302, partial [Stegodyphus mimosarum]